MYIWEGCTRDVQSRVNEKYLHAKKNTSPNNLPLEFGPSTLVASWSGPTVAMDPTFLAAPWDHIWDHVASAELLLNGATSGANPAPGYPVVGYKVSDCHYLHGHHLASSDCSLSYEEELIKTITDHYNRLPTTEGKALDGHRCCDGNNVPF